MKLLKSVGAAMVSLAMLAGTALPAAAEESYMKLLTVPVEEVLGTPGIGGAPGIGIYGSRGLGKFVRITEDDLTAWRESDEISYSTVSTDIALNGMSLRYFYDFTDDDSYSLFGKFDESGNVAQRVVVRYNEDNNAIEAVSEYDEWCTVTSDGYVIRYGRNGGELNVLVTSPDGTDNPSVFALGEKDGSYFYGVNTTRTSDKYIMYVMLAASITNNEELTASEGFTIDDCGIEIYGIDRNGNAEQLDKGTFNWWSTIDAGENYFLYHGETHGLPTQYRVYLSDTNEVIDIDLPEIYVFDGDGYGADIIDSLGDRIYGTKAIAYNEPSYKANDDWYGTYALVDLKTGEQIATHRNIGTEDGKIFLIENAEGKWGYMNAKGKVLRTYDYASSFIGDYAPVVKDGKAFLIDRSMKRVSEKIDADYVVTLNKDLFRVIKDDEEFFMTFDTEMTAAPAEDDKDIEAPEDPVITPDKPETEAPEAPVEPTPAQSASAASTSSANKGNPDTGVAVAVVPLLIAGAGMAVLTRKRK